MKKDEIIERLRNDEDYYGEYGNQFLSNSHIGKLLKNPMSLYDKTPDNPNFKDYDIEAAKSLIQLKNSGKSDADANTILALLARAQGQAGIANDLAAEVAQSEQQPTRAKVEALRLLAQIAYQRRNFAESAKLYRQVTQYQSEAFDYFQLGIAEQNSGQTEQAITALKKAVELAPTYIEAHRVLAAILGSQGKTIESNKHQQLAQQHQQRLQQLWRSRQLK